MGDSMSTIINATTTNGVVIQPDNSGSLVLQTNSGTTALTIDTSQRAAFVAGTAALPAITTTGDTNTGIFFPAADTIAFSEGGAESMRINSAGNLGIGTSSPSYKLSIAGNSATSSNLLLTHNTDSTGAYSRIKFAFAEGNLSISSEIRNIQRAAGENGASLAFFTDSNAGSLTERMRIDSSGNVLVGATSFAGAAGRINISYGSGAYGLKIASTVSGSTNSVQFISSADNEVGTIGVNNTNTSYNTSSDYRLKDNVVPMIGALATVAQLKPVTYKWKIDGSDGQGFIAHELQSVVPDCVTGEKDAVDAEGNSIYQGIDTSFLVATLTAAIQEQQTIINDLKARVETLEAK
jgi:hypothetical protein